MSIDLEKPITYRELISLSEDDLIERHDNLLKKDHIIVGLDYYLQALRHKTQEKQTCRILLFTVIVAIATIINVIIAFKFLPK